jgi:hypothetical protein
MGLVPGGGYVITTSRESHYHIANVDEQTLQKVAELLGISKAERDRLISDTRSIYIFRGPGGQGKR